ncbi:MAG TPA: polynucleotide 5'-hydroxyl-kinase [Roseomonas sp.]|jgi:polynucleotide 5'-hydroxyl-kinase GRC3/NOL9
MTIETPPDWQAALQSILDRNVRHVLVLGAPDAGKSTFCGILLAHAVAASRKAALLDADPGQKQVGPPACVTLGHLGTGGRPVLSALVFLGTIEPLRCWPRLLAGAASLAAEARADLVVINTCGLLRGPGRRLKAAIISAMRPDLLVTIGEDRNAETILADHPGIPALRLPRSALARRKGEGERRTLRRAAFRNYFEQAPCWPLLTNRIHLESGDGEALPPPGRLVALADKAGRDLVLGLVMGQAPSGHLLLKAPQPDRVVAGLRWGRLGLDEAWAEQWATFAQPGPPTRHQSGQA